MAEWSGETGARGVRTMEALVSIAVAHLWPRQDERNESEESKVHNGHVVYGGCYVFHVCGCVYAYVYVCRFVSSEISRGLFPNPVMMFWWDFVFHRFSLSIWAMQKSSKCKPTRAV